VRRLIVALALLALGGCATAGSTTAVAPATEQYIGGYQDGLRSGEGTYIWPDGRKYVGTFRGGLPNGQGTYTLANGEKYVGAFQDNRRTRGTYSWPDGRTYVGTFQDDRPNGSGIYSWPDGKKYVGEFHDGRIEGQGTFTWPDGRKYIGALRNDLPDGQGVLTLADGRQQAGTFRNGDFVGPGGSTGTGAGTGAVVLASAAAPAPVGGDVPLEKRGGTYMVSVLINGSMSLDFYLDSGAADVSVPADTFENLKRIGSIRPEDIVGPETYLMANGASHKAMIFRIRSLRLGNVLLENVRGSVSDVSGPPLLGMSFLGRFAVWSVDNGRSVLTLK
jgi:clan AA aspartic protease (TIGR02281 family)